MCREAVYLYHSGSNRVMLPLYSIYRLRRLSASYQAQAQEIKGGLFLAHKLDHLFIEQLRMVFKHFRDAYRHRAVNENHQVGDAAFDDELVEAIQYLLRPLQSEAGYDYVSSGFHGCVYDIG